MIGDLNTYPNSIFPMHGVRQWHEVDFVVLYNELKFNSNNEWSSPVAFGSFCSRKQQLKFNSNNEWNSPIALGRFCNHLQ